MLAERLCRLHNLLKLRIELMYERLIFILLFFILLLAVCGRLWYYFGRSVDELYSDYRNKIDGGRRRFEKILLRRRIFWVTAFAICAAFELAFIFLPVS